MDDAFNRQLIAQEQSLRVVQLAFAHARASLPAAVPGPEWIGPASAAYQAAVDHLRTQLAAVDDRLDEALRYTRLAIATRQGP